MRVERIGQYRVPSEHRLYSVREIYDSVFEHFRVCFENAVDPTMRYKVHHDDLSDEVNVSDERLISGINLMLGVLDKITDYEYSDGGSYLPSSTAIRFRAKVLHLYPKNIQYGSLEMFDVMDYLELCLMTYQDEDMGRRIVSLSSTQVGNRGSRVKQNLDVRQDQNEEIRLRAYLNFQVLWNYV